MKKIIVFLLVLSVCLSLVACGGKQPAETQQSGDTQRTEPADGSKPQEPVIPPETNIGSEGLEFVSNGDGTCYLSGMGTCTDTDVVIPSVSPDGDRVVAIHSYAFYKKYITSISIPSSVTRIGESAFYGCKKLTSVYIFDLKAWCNIDFLSNPLENEADLYLNGELIIDLVIPDGVTAIKPCAFAGCASLMTVDTGKSVTCIGERAFDGCSHLISLLVREGATEIAIDAFGFSDSIYEVYNLSGNELFLGGANTKIHYSLSEPSNLWTNDDGYVFFDNEEACYLVGYKGREADLTLPEDCRGKNYEIGYKAFIDCKYISSVTIPDGVTSIHSWAFEKCENLKHVTIGNGVTDIGWSAFYLCTNLTSVIIGNKVSTIWEEAFAYCTALESVTIGSSLTEIQSSVFEECGALTRIDYSGTMAKWNAISKGYDWDWKADHYTVFCTDGEIKK